jgi:ubiquitin-activating enzyme E1
MDGRCVEFGKPLLECGTLGTIGSVQVVVPHLTESYSSFEDVEMKDAIPVCTLKLFPSTFEHVIEYARSVFEQYFNVPQSTYRSLMADSNVLRMLEHKSSVDLVSIQKQLFELLANSLNSNFKYCIRYGFNMFHQLFVDPISQLIQKYPFDHKVDGELFWSGSKIFPKVSTFDVQNADHIGFVIKFAHIFADSIGIAQKQRYGTNQIKKFEDFVRTLKTPDPVPCEDIQNTAEVEADVDREILIQQIMCLIEKSRTKLSNVEPIVFEKDDDSNNHVDFLALVSNLRASNYSIKPEDRLFVKGTAGKIIPAIATTTSIVSGLISLEFCKLVYRSILNPTDLRTYDTCSKYRYGTFNLASSVFAFGESVHYKTTRIGKEKYDIWRIDKFDHSQTLQSIVDYYNSLTDCNNVESGDSNSDDSNDDNSDMSSAIDECDGDMVSWIVHSMYAGDTLLYNEFERSNTSKTLTELNSNLDLFNITMIREDMIGSEDMDAKQKACICIKFRI